MSKTEWTKKIIIIVIGSIIAAYGITLALYAGFGGATLAVLMAGDFKDISYKYRHGISDCSHNYDRVLIFL